MVIKKKMILLFNVASCFARGYEECDDMAIRINLDVMMARRKISLTELAKEVDITLANLSILKNGKAKAVRLETLNAICKALQCQPGDILEYVEEEKNEEA